MSEGGKLFLFYLILGVSGLVVSIRQHRIATKKKERRDYDRALVERGVEVTWEKEHGHED